MATSRADERAHATDERAHGADERAHGADERARGADERARGADERAHGADERAHGADERAHAILARVHAIPAGFVRSYGDVSPGAPRVAGAVLHDCDDPSIPWHRVVRADGSLAKGSRQRLLLEREGVPFRGGRVDMRIARIPEH